MPDDANGVFAARAQVAIEGLLSRQPEWATGVGEHRYDSALTVGTAAHHVELSRWAGEQLARLDAVGLSTQNGVDARILANHLTRLRFGIDELREYEWNPMLANPGQALHLLLARDFAPGPERLLSAAGRLGCVPESLAAARAVLGQMPQVHIETALGQFAGARRLIEDQLAPLAQAANGAGRELAAAIPPALEALGEHIRWLEQKQADGQRDGFRDPRLGPELYAAKLRLVLDTDLDPDELLARAEAELAQAGEQIAAAAAAFLGPGASTGSRVRRALDLQAADVVDDATVLGFLRAALGAVRAFVAEHDIVTVFDEPVQVIEMPEINRGGAIAYCDAPGPLETAPLPTFIAVSPTPASWPAARVASFYRENNVHLIHDMVSHEGYPGHALQLAHCRRLAASALVRSLLRSRSFVEGWAVYVERLMGEYEYPGAGNPAAVQLQRLKAYIKAIINAIMDVRVHCHGMTEAEAMALMTGPGFQEEGEAAAKWRRVLLTSADLTTYYVGFTEVSGLVASLRGAHPDWPDRQLHDAMLAHGSPPVRHLRALLGIQPAS